MVYDKNTHHFAELPRGVAQEINSENYFKIKPCKRGHTAPRGTKHGSCKECNKIRGLEYSRDNQLSIYYKCKKNNCKYSGIEFTLTLEDISDIPQVCPVLGIPIELYQGSGLQGIRDNSATLDRIDPSKGYTKENVRWLSGRANRLKSNMTLDEIQKLYTYMKENSK